MDCDLSAGTLTVTDARSGAIWSSAVDMERFGITTNKTWTAYMQSLFAFSYVDVEADNGVVQKAYSANEPADVKAEKIPGGVRLRYRFTKTKIQITAEIRLDQEGLRFTLPAKGIAEEGKYGLVSVEVLPFFGAADHTVDGYILFPDGSGSLMDYADYQNRPAQCENLSAAGLFSRRGDAVHPGWKQRRRYAAGFRHPAGRERLYRFRHQGGGGRRDPGFSGRGQCGPQPLCLRFPLSE